MAKCYLCNTNTEIDTGYFDKHLVQCSDCGHYFISDSALKLIEVGVVHVDQSVLKNLRKTISQHGGNRPQENGDYPIISAADFV